jgi:hypothetical protein
MGSAGTKQSGFTTNFCVTLVISREKITLAVKKSLGSFPHSESTDGSEFSVLGGFIFGGIPGLGSHLVGTEGGAIRPVSSSQKGRIPWGTPRSF